MLHQLGGVAARHAFEAGLRSVIVNAEYAGTARCARGYVDDPAPVALAHAFTDGLGAKKYRLEVGRDRVIEIRLGDFIERPANRHGCIVDQNIHGPESLLDVRDHGRDRFCIGNLCAERGRSASRFFHGCHRGIRSVLAFLVADGDIGTGIRQRQRNRFSDPARSTGNKSDTGSERLHGSGAWKVRACHKGHGVSSHTHHPSPITGHAFSASAAGKLSSIVTPLGSSKKT